MSRAKFNIFRDGKVHVQRAMCPTCIFRDSSVISVERRDEMRAAADRDESTIVCHETIGTRTNAACRGYFDNGCSAALQIAERLNVIEWVHETWATT